MLLYSIVYRFRDLEYHEDTITVGTDEKIVIALAKEWAKQISYFQQDDQSFWLYCWKDGKCVNQIEIQVQFQPVFIIKVGTMFVSRFHTTENNTHISFTNIVENALKYPTETEAAADFEKYNSYVPDKKWKLIKYQPKSK